MYCGLCSSWICKVITKNQEYLETLTLLTLMFDVYYVLATEIYSEHSYVFLLVFLMMLLSCMQMASYVV